MFIPQQVHKTQSGFPFATAVCQCLPLGCFNGSFLTIFLFSGSFQWVILKSLFIQSAHQRAMLDQFSPSKNFLGCQRARSNSLCDVNRAGSFVTTNIMMSAKKKEEESANDHEAISWDEKSYFPPKKISKEASLEQCCEFFADALTGVIASCHDLGHTNSFFSAPV